MRSPEEAKSGPVSVIFAPGGRAGEKPQSITTAQQIVQSAWQWVASCPPLCLPNDVEGARHIGTPYVVGMRAEDILALTPSGVCCKLGDFHIDPTRPVARA